MSVKQYLMRQAGDLAGALAIGAGLAALVTRQPAQVSLPTMASQWRPRIGWFQLLRNVAKEVSDDRVLAVAAGVAFFGLLSLFPAVTAFVSLYGLLVPVAQIQDHLMAAGALVPDAANAMIQDQVTKLTMADSAALSIASVLALLMSVWSANGAMKAMMDALNVAYGVKDRRSFIRYNAIGLAMTMGAVAVIICLLLTLAAIPYILRHLWLGWASEVLLSYGRWPLLLAVLLTAIAVLYRFGPDVPNARWRWITPGSVVAGLAIVLFSLGFSWYAANFAHYNETYGSLGAAIAFMIWGWLSATIVLVGAEINAELDRQNA